MNRTLVLIKPDAIRRALFPHIVMRFMYEGLTVGDPKVFEPGEDTTRRLEEHYADVLERHSREIYDSNIKFMQSGPIMAVEVSGEEDVVARVRVIVGATDPAKATPASIRGAYGGELPKNLVHASDSDESAARELAIWMS